VAFYGESYPRDPETERWHELRRDHPEEYAARMNHDPRHWELPLQQISAGIEAG